MTPTKNTQPVRKIATEKHLLLQYYYTETAFTETEITGSEKMLFALKTVYWRRQTSLR